MIDIVGKGKRFIQRWKRRTIKLWLLMTEKRHYYTSLQSYALERPDKAEILSIRAEKLAYAMEKHNYIIENAGQLVLKKAKIKDATCFVFSDIVMLEDGRILYEMKELDNLIPYINFMDEILLKDTTHWCKLRKYHYTRNIDKAIKISGKYSFNYYHFMFQILPKLFEITNIDPSIPLLMDYTASEIPSMKQLVEYCNIDHREVIYMEYDIAYQVGELYTISCPNFLIPDLKRTLPAHIIGCSYSTKSINELVSRLLPYADEKPSSKRIFVCRNKAGKRRKYNEQELFDIARQFGFEAISPEKLTIEEQISTFHNADIIIAPSGAALTNLLFIKPGVIVIILYNLPSSKETLWESIIKLLGGNVIALFDSRCTNRLKYQRDFNIDPNKLKETIKQIETINKV